MLRHLPDHSVQCCVTSPPYWQLRDYGVPGQIGLEPTPHAYIEKLVAVFGEVRRVLRDDGVLWLNLGDSYAGSIKGQAAKSHGKLGKHAHHFLPGPTPPTIPAKNLLGIPWRVAFALQADGWILRSDVIWQKPNCLPESVQDRPTKAHEYLFLFAKKKSYYYDANAIREPHTMKPQRRLVQRHSRRDEMMRSDKKYVHTLRTEVGVEGNSGGRNRRTVWSIPTHPYKGAHYATFPEKLVEICILAGSSPHACEQCGAPWKRVTLKGGEGNQREPAQVPERNTTKTDSDAWASIQMTTSQWESTCSCPDNTGRGHCVILDPFAGSGTVLSVASRFRHQYLGIELNPAYILLARQRLASVRDSKAGDAAGDQHTEPYSPQFA